MPLNDLTGKPLKHYAQDEVSKDRYVVIALQNDTDQNTCSVIAYDRLDPDLRSELINVVNSDECQRVPEIWKVLDKKFFYSYPKQTMLQVLRALKQILVVDESRVKIELPGDMTMTPKQIVDAMRMYEQEKSVKTATKFHVSEDGVRTELGHNDARIDDMETRISGLETKIDSISANISDLINAIKHSASKTEE